MATIPPTGKQQTTTELDLTTSRATVTEQSRQARTPPFLRVHAPAFFRAYAVYVVLGLAVSALAVLGLLWVSQRNHPAFSFREIKQTIRLSDRLENVEITCSCPEVFTVSMPRTLTFRIQLQEDPKQPQATKEQLESQDALSVFLNTEGGADVKEANASTYVGATLGQIFRDKTADGAITATITAKDMSFARFRFDFVAQNTSVASIPWAVRTQMDAITVASPFLIGFLVFVAILSIGFFAERAIRQSGKRAREVEQAAIQKAAANPGKLRYDWQLASNRLNQYFEGNLAQVRLVFWIAVLVMFVGFSFVLGGIFLAIRNSTPQSAWLSGSAGVITQFIGATFLVIYRSTMSQASSFMAILQQMNTTGTALLVLDSMPDGDPKKLDTQATVVSALLKAPPVASVGQAEILAKGKAVGTV